MYRRVTRPSPDQLATILATHPDLKSAARTLDCSARTLGRWLDAAGIEVERQLVPRRRRRYPRHLWSRLLGLLR